MRLVTDTIEWCATEMPRWNPISISGYHIREAGSTAAQELLSRSTTGCLRRAGVERGLDVDVFAPRLLLLQRPQRLLRGDRQVSRRPPHLGARAARHIRAKDERSMLMRFHAQTAGVSLTAQQPRSTSSAPPSRRWPACWAARSLCTRTRSTRRLRSPPRSGAGRLRTQQVIAHETGVTNTADPLGGAYSSRSSQTRWRRPPTSTSTGSTRWAAWSPRSRPASRRARSPTPPTVPAAGRVGPAHDRRRQRLRAGALAQSGDSRPDPEAGVRQSARIEGRKGAREARCRRRRSPGSLRPHGAMPT